MPKRDISSFIAKRSATSPSAHTNSEAFLPELGDALEFPVLAYNAVVDQAAVTGEPKRRCA